MGKPVFDLVSLSAEIDALPLCLQPLARFAVPLPEAVMVVRIGGEIAFVNPAVVSRLGYSRAECLGKTLAQLIGSERHPLPLAEDIEALLQRGESAQSTITIRCKDGRLVRQSMITTPVRDAAGAFGWWTVHLHDLTPLTRLQGRLEASERLAALGTMATGMVHELRGSLVQLREHSQALRADHPADERLAALSEGLKTMERTVEELLERAADDARCVRPMALSAILSRAISTETESLRHVQLRRDPIPEHLQVLAAPRLVQAIAGLLRNAAQSIAEDQPGAEVRISARADAEHVQLWIIDNGAGIPSEDCERVLEPFFTTRPQGLGLGLSTAQDVIHQLDGSLTIAPRRRRRGTMVTVRLPRAGAAPVAAADPGALRVLIIDDDTRVAKALGRLLMRHRVELSDSGEDALSRLAEESFDVVICDLMMPGMSGLELFARLELEQPALARRVLFTTGGAWSEQSREFISTHRRRVITKPFKRAHLNKTIDWVVRTHQA